MKNCKSSEKVRKKLNKRVDFLFETMYNVNVNRKQKEQDMKTVYNYKKITKRINELEAMRDESGKFQGTYEELDELMYLDTYHRQTLAHALCLDFKTKVTQIDNYFPCGDGSQVRLSSTVIQLNKNVYTVEIEKIEEEKHKCFNYNEILVLKPIAYGKERRFILKSRDVSCCDCYYLGQEITEQIAV